MDRFRFVKFDVLTNHGRKELNNFWGTAYKALHNGTQGLTSALKRSTSAYTYRTKDEPRPKDTPEICTEALDNIHETPNLATDSETNSDSEEKCVMAEDTWGISESAKTKAIKELNEDPANRQKCIDEMRDFITTRQDIEFLRIDDAFLLRFLRARKFDVPVAFQLYCRYFEYRRNNESLFLNFSASEPGIQHALLDGFPGVLFSPDQHGHRVLVFFTANWDHSRYGLLAIYRALLLTLENLMAEEESQIHGFVLIVDWSGFTFRQSSLLQPKLLRLIIEGLQDCFPGRFAGIHFVNQPWYIEAALTIIKSFLKEKTKDKIYLHGNNLTILHNYIIKDILPAELGGSRPPYNNEQWARKLIGDESFAFSDSQLSWPVENDTSKTISNQLRPIHSETFPADLCKSRCIGQPSVTELDEDFFLS